MLNQTLTPELLNKAYCSQTLPAITIGFIFIFLVFIIFYGILVKGLKIKKFVWVWVASLLFCVIFLIVMYVLPTLMQLFIKSLNICS